MEKGELDQLSHNYEDMDEIGKEKLKVVSEHILKIWETVHEKTEVPKLNK